MDQYLLGIDVGTTGTKTLLFATDGKLLGRAYRPYALHTPKVGYSEQDPHDWWNAVVETVREVCADADIAQKVAAISLSLQGGTLAPVDATGEPVRPAIVWNDARCEKQMAAFLEEVGPASLMYEKTGWELEGALPAMEIRWLRENEPENFAKTAMFLSVPDYIALKMTGIPAIDLSDMGINQLGDIRKGCYDPKLLGFVGITEKQLPKILYSGEVIGKLTPEAAEQLGINPEAVLVAGAHDQYAVALGAGATKGGDILIGSGTSWVVTAIGEEPAFETGLSQSVAAVPGKWGSLMSLSSGGVCLEWWRRSLTVSDDGSQIDYDRINREAAARTAAEDGLFFFPFSGLAGDKVQFQRGSFVGMDLSHDRFHLIRAIMEGVAFQVVWMMEAFQTKPSQEGLILAGGASRSELWCQMVADISGLPVRIPEVADLACVGAAVLAGTGCGIYRNVEEGYRRLAVRERKILPDPEKTKMYQDLFASYKRYAAALGGAYACEQ